MDGNYTKALPVDLFKHLQQQISTKLDKSNKSQNATKIPLPTEPNTPGQTGRNPTKHYNDINIPIVWGSLDLFPGLESNAVGLSPSTVGAGEVTHHTPLSVAPLPSAGGVYCVPPKNVCLCPGAMHHILAV